MKRHFWGILLIALGVMGFLQVSGQFNFGLSFWPVALYIGSGLLIAACALIVAGFKPLRKASGLFSAEQPAT